VGDPIVVQTVQGTFHYAVSTTTMVDPSDSAVLDPTTRPELTLTTCNPRSSATQRLVVVALLQSSRLTGTVGAGSSTPPKATHVVRRVLATADGAVGGSVLDAVLWGFLTGGAGLGLWLLWRRVRGCRRWGVLTLGTPLVLIVLFVFFGHASSVLPASF